MMSKPLDFLINSRPEAATAYFTFLKESGKHLDDKTRFLISVATKVISSTRRGIRQYVPHAIRAGASGNEIIDAVLMAFPAAGLTKVLDAVEALMEMDLPEISSENLNREKGWYDLVSMSDLPDEGTYDADIFGYKLLVYRKDGQTKVYDNRCPHQWTSLQDMKIEGKSITCSKHHWKFDLDSGECVEKGSRGVRLVPSKVEGNQLQVEV